MHLIVRQENNYLSIDKIGQYGSQGSAAALVFCVHGNKWGLATCCEDLENDFLTTDIQPMVLILLLISYIYINLNFLLQLSDKFSKEDYLHCHTYSDEGGDKK